MELIEYRVRPVTRYIVTRFACQTDDAGIIRKGVEGPRTVGEYENAATAYEVGHALCKAEHERLGWPIADDRIKYPQDPRVAPQSVRPAGELAIETSSDNYAPPGTPLTA